MTSGTSGVCVRLRFQSRRHASWYFCRQRIEATSAPQRRVLVAPAGDVAVQPVEEEGEGRHGGGGVEVHAGAALQVVHREKRARTPQAAFARVKKSATWNPRIIEKCFKSSSGARDRWPLRLRPA